LGLCSRPFPFCSSSFDASKAKVILVVAGLAAILGAVQIASEAVIIPATPVMVGTAISAGEVTAVEADTEAEVTAVKLRD